MTTHQTLGLLQVAGTQTLVCRCHLSCVCFNRALGGWPTNEHKAYLQLPFILFLVWDVVSWYHVSQASLEVTDQLAEQALCQLICTWPIVTRVPNAHDEFPIDQWVHKCTLPFLNLKTVFKHLCYLCFHLFCCQRVSFFLSLLTYLCFKMCFFSWKNVVC